MKLFESRRYKGKTCPFECELPSRLYIGHRLEIQFIPSRLFNRFSIRLEGQSKESEKQYSPLLFYYGNEYDGRMVLRTETDTTQQESVESLHLTLTPDEPVVFSIVIQKDRLRLCLTDELITVAECDDTVLKDIKRIKLDGDILVLYVDLMVDSEFRKQNGDVKHLQVSSPLDRTRAHATMCCGDCVFL